MALLIVFKSYHLSDFTTEPEHDKTDKLTCVPILVSLPCALNG